MSKVNIFVFFKASQYSECCKVYRIENSVFVLKLQLNLSNQFIDLSFICQYNNFYQLRIFLISIIRTPPVFRNFYLCYNYYFISSLQYFLSTKQHPTIVILIVRHLPYFVISIYKKTSTSLISIVRTNAVFGTCYL